MASGYPVPFEGQGEVKEGFLCPLCLKDLQSFYQLQEHYETEHRGEDGHVKGQLKSLVQKAKKAKDKLLKRDGDERADAGAYESFYCGGVDPYMWEPQELGATRSHLDDFKKYRAARIDHYVIEVNKLIIRLEKLTSFDRTNADAAKIRAIEKSVVSWVSDSDVPLCPDCGNRFNLRNRRHHCRLCGSIMCRRCMEFVPLPMAYKLTSGTQEALCGSPGQTQSRSPPPGGSAQGSRRGSISSLSSVSSVLEEKDDERIRCCRHCMDTLLKRQEKLEEKGHVPDVVKLYERLRLCMDKVDQKAPEYIQMAESLNSGETTYNLDHANDLRMEVQKYYELIDALSKKILSLGMTEEPPPHPKTLQLQRMIRYSATLFVQEKLLGLMSLPTKDKYEELKIKRKEELEKKMQQERLAALEAQKKRSELEKARPVSSHNGESTGGESAKPVMTKSGGWLPASSTLHTRAIEDPLLQQIDNIQSFIKQARAAQRFDEVATLEENLRQLQDEYDQQQTSLAIELSRKTAEEEGQQEQQQEEEGISRRSLHCNSSLDIWDARGTRALEDELDDGEGNWRTARTKSSPPSRSQSTKTYRRLPSQENAPPQQLRRRDNPPVQAAVQVPSPAVLSNPFEDEDSSPLAEDPSNPFAEEILKEKSQKGMMNGKKPYNPFDEEEEQPAPNPGESPGGLNPFEDEDDEHNPFSEPSKGTTPAVRPGASTNPFDDDDAPDKDAIDEELLLQQIDNIRAYIFDAKLSGRVDEVELLSENLRELQHTLQEQRRKTH